VTLTDIRAQHKAHSGFIWQCPHCAAGYWTRLQIEEPDAYAYMVAWGAVMKG
jgi:hypothetical protein